MRYEELLQHPPFGVAASQKSEMLKSALRVAMDHHRRACPEFDRICTKRQFDTFNRFEEIPYLPVSLFKRLSLSSAPPEDHVRTIESSATTSQTPSRVAIDQTTRMRQTKSLAWLLSDALGPERRPFYIVEAPLTLERGDLSARAAAMRGFLMAASSTTYLPDAETMARELGALEKSEAPAVIFGYTFRVYLDLALKLKEEGQAFRLPRVTLLHFGGWKKLQSLAVSRPQFHAVMQEVLGIEANQLVDAFGFTEQLGIIYIDRGDGVKRCPLISEIVIRDPQTLEPVPDGEAGLIELITPLPHSYPGIALLLDDVGRIVSRDPSPEGRHGTAFEVLGRAEAAEIRGCGDITALEERRR